MTAAVLHLRGVKRKTAEWGISFDVGHLMTDISSIYYSLFLFFNPSLSFEFLVSPV